VQQEGARAGLVCGPHGPDAQSEKQVRPLDSTTPALASQEAAAVVVVASWSFWEADVPLSILRGVSCIPATCLNLHLG
jgi:hypothetical protein